MSQAITPNLRTKMILTKLAKTFWLLEKNITVLLFLWEILIPALEVQHASVWIKKSTHMVVTLLQCAMIVT